MWDGRGSAVAYSQSQKKVIGAMKWLDDVKEAGAAFLEWGRWMTIIGAVMAVSLVVIAVELLVVCIKL